MGFITFFDNIYESHYTIQLAFIYLFIFFNFKNTTYIKMFSVLAK